MTAHFKTRLAETAQSVDAVLARLLADAPKLGETTRPPRLVAAMRHAALGGGKRLRPFLLAESARLCGRTGESVMLAAAALECVHCYSLVHDDLPAMDDDDLRRGQPTVHRAFDEATAILAGDALLTLAFDVLANPAVDDDAAIRVELIAGLAEAAGLGGMAGGQMLDLTAEGGGLDEDAIAEMHAMKTGALIRYAATAGAVIARADVDDRARLASFGERLGRAFQLADDLIDATGEASVAGKATAKDAGRGKATFVALHGVEAARRQLDKVTAEAIAILKPFGGRATTLAALARFVATREA